MRGKRITVLTGAGVSTDSGIPDYRGEGAQPRNPMTFQQFVGSAESQNRYWAGSHLGWQMFSSAKPNNGHLALAMLEQFGISNGVITQNVDGLHRQAGSQKVVELHGNMIQVLCLDCGQRYDRNAIANQLSALNPNLDINNPGVLAPDGDVEVLDAVQTVIPKCAVCGGRLKPDVVFFGELVPAATFQAASALVADAEVLLVAGSSLAVNSGIRLITLARRKDIPIVIVNRGATKGDRHAALKLDNGTTEALEYLAKNLVSYCDFGKVTDYEPVISFGAQLKFS